MSFTQIGNERGECRREVKGGGNVDVRKEQCKVGKLLFELE